MCIDRISALIPLWAARTPDAIALQTDEADYSYAELEKLLTRLCHGLQSAGLLPGMTLACMDDHRLATALLVFAAPRIGCRLLVLSPVMPATLVSEFLQYSGARMLVTETYPAAEAVVSYDLDDLFEMGVGVLETGEQFQSGLVPEDTHLLLATSGSSGKPKLAMLSGINLMSSVGASKKRIPVDQHTSWLLCLPLCHIGGIAVLLRCAEAGGRVVLHQSFDASRVVRALYRLAVTHVSLVPTTLMRIDQANQESAPPSSLKAVLVGGGALSPAVGKDLLNRGWPICLTYGLTEAASQVATCCPAPECWQPGLVGTALDHMEVSIDKGSASILIKGEGLMQGYLGIEGNNNLPLVNGWFKTGDLGEINEAGELRVLGRSDQVLISGGENVDPTVVENLLRELEGIEDAAVSAIPDQEWGQSLVAFYTGIIEEQVVETWARERLRGVYCPRKFNKVDTLPYGASGKLQRARLQGLCRDHSMTQGGEE